ncbi:MAG: hypothetical protein JKY62_17320, partial [Desulfocapsa sp.]|nr:hypothetical protein [Desulfocapsa sp.]
MNDYSSVCLTCKLLLYGFIFDFIIVLKSSKNKVHFVVADEKESNKRMVLNFGHTFAHGIESSNNFSKKINHGEAVLIGMLLA